MIVNVDKLKTRFILRSVSHTEDIFKCLSFAVVKRLAQLYKDPQTFNYTKIHDRYTLNLAFPNAMGLPFIFTLQLPTLVKISAETSIRSKPDLARGPDSVVVIPESLNVTTDLQFV
jgi:hypothetical protein